MFDLIDFENMQPANLEAPEIDDDFDDDLPPAEPVDNNDVAVGDSLMAPVFNADVPPAEPNSHETNLRAEKIIKMRLLRSCISDDIVACEARWTLFVSAAFNIYCLTALNPYPPRYIRADGSFSIDDLNETIQSVPKFQALYDILTAETVNAIETKAIDLLYWVLIEQRGQSKLQLLPPTEIEQLLSDLKLDFGRADNKPKHIFKVNDSADMESDFQRKRANLPTRFAFHGCRNYKFNAMLNHGFFPRLELGETIKFTTDLIAAREHSPEEFTWIDSHFCGAVMSCIAIAEIIIHPVHVEEINRCGERGIPPRTEYRLEYMNLARIRYILLYGRSLAERMVDVRRQKEEELRRPTTCTTGLLNNKYLLTAVASVVLLAAFKGTGTGDQWRAYLAENFNGCIDYLKRMFWSYAF